MNLTANASTKSSIDPNLKRRELPRTSSEALAIDVTVQLPFRTDFNLFRFVRDNLWQSCIRRDLSAEANSPPFVVVFRSPEFTPIISPDHDSEDLIRIGLVEIQEC